MKLSKTSEIILDQCWSNNEPRGTSFVVGDKYNVNGIEIKPNDNTHEELVKYQSESPRPYKIVRFGKVVNVMGGRLK